MGRRPWATAEQLDFLKSFVGDLDRAKATTGLTALYDRVYADFLSKWDPEPVVQKRGEFLIPEELQTKANARLKSRIVEWFKVERKKSTCAPPQHPAPTTRLLDLSGKSNRRTCPHQLHQAYSIRYWRPGGSPLRAEVEDLWARRTEDSVREMLREYLSESVKASSTTSEKLLFHMAVMCWKCSLLNTSERAELEQWIDEEKKRKDTARDLPWYEEAEEHGDRSFAENAYIQHAIDSIPQTMQVALEEVERQTGWKSIIILGGLEPKTGMIGSHLYTTGTSIDTGDKFHEAYPEVAGVRTFFHQWLRTAISDDEKQKRAPRDTASVLSVIAPRVDGIENPTTCADTTGNVPPSSSDPHPPDRPPSPSINASDLQARSASPSPMDAIDTTGPSVTGTEPNDTLNHLLQAPSPPQSLSLEIDFSTLPPSRSSSGDLALSCPGTPAPQHPAPQPLLAATGSDAFDITGIDGGFVTDATCAYWESVPGGETWAKVIRKYVVLEKMGATKGQLQRLPTAFRPQELRVWLESKRPLDQQPSIVSSQAYGTEWVGWWKKAQPRERNTQQWPFSTDAGSDSQWRKFPANGKDGVFLAVMALSWWAFAVRSFDEVAFFEQAAVDLLWVIEQLIRVKTNQLLPPPSPPPQSDLDGCRQPTCHSDPSSRGSRVSPYPPPSRRQTRSSRPASPPPAISPAPVSPRRTRSSRLTSISARAAGKLVEKSTGKAKSTK